MRRTTISLSAVLFLLFACGSAAAGPNPGAFFYKGGPPVKAPAPKPKAPPKTAGAGGKKTVPSHFTGKRCVRRTCRYYKNGRLVKSCTKRGRRTTCTYYNLRGRATRVCTQARPGARFKCRRVRVRNAALSTRAFDSVDSSAAWQPGRKVDTRRSFHGLNGQGWTNPLIGAVGAIYYNDQQNCSGTLIARGIVLTAGHCLYEPGGAGFGNANYAFAPGQTWLEGYNLPNHVYGYWYARKVWVSPGWLNGDSGVDWGMMELLPDANGNYPGDTVGSFVAQSDIFYNPGAHVYLAGYPGEGIFATPDLHNGLGQYFCDTTWDSWLIPPGHTGLPNTGSNYYFAHQCSMVYGSSGGPVFVQLSDNSWVVGGVVNQGELEQCPADNSCRFSGIPFYSRWVETAWFDSRLIDLWNQVLQG